MKIFIISVLMSIITLTILVMPVYAVGDVDISSGTSSNTVNSLVGNIWATVSVIIYVLAVGCIIFAGIRYISSAADTKANIKKQTRHVNFGSYYGFFGNIHSKYCIRCNA